MVDNQSLLRLVYSEYIDQLVMNFTQREECPSFFDNMPHKSLCRLRKILAKYFGQVLSSKTPQTTRQISLGMLQNSNAPFERHHRATRQWPRHCKMYRRMLRAKPRVQTWILRWGWYTRVKVSTLQESMVRFSMKFSCHGPDPIVILPGIEIGGRGWDLSAVKRLFALLEVTLLQTITI